MEDIYMLTITGVTMKMTGTYRCVATNNKGTVEHSAMITIYDGKTPIKKLEEKKPEEKSVEKRREENVEPNLEEKNQEYKKPDDKKPSKKKTDKMQTQPDAAGEMLEAEARLILEKQTEEKQQSEVSLSTVDKPVELLQEAQLVLGQAVQVAPDISIKGITEKLIEIDSQFVLGKPEEMQADASFSQALGEYNQDAAVEFVLEQTPQEKEVEAGASMALDEDIQEAAAHFVLEQATVGQLTEAHIEKPEECAIGKPIEATQQNITDVEAGFVLDRPADETQQAEVSLAMTPKPAEHVQGTQLILEQLEEIVPEGLVETTPKKPVKGITDELVETDAQFVLGEPEEMQADTSFSLALGEDVQDSTAEFVLEQTPHEQEVEAGALMALDEDIQEVVAQFVLEQATEEQTAEAGGEETVENAVRKPVETDTRFTLETKVGDFKHADDASLSMEVMLSGEDQANVVPEQLTEAVFETMVEAVPVKPIDTGAPMFVEVYEDMAVLLKKTVTLTVKITGKPAPIVEWFR